MPSGRTHDRITLLCCPWVAGLSLLVTLSVTVTLVLVGGFLFSGLMFGPDLDIYSKQYQRWGLLRFIWGPYQKALKHRSFLSHGPVIGTLLRLIYFSLWSMLAFGLCQIIANGLGQPVWTVAQILETLAHLGKYHLQYCLALLVGLELGAMSHAISDSIGSGLKAIRRRFK